MRVIETLIWLVENGRKFCKSAENILGKGEIAQKSNFSFSHSVFKRLVPQTSKNQGLFWKGLKKGLLSFLDLLCEKDLSGLYQGSGLWFCVLETWCVMK